MSQGGPEDLIMSDPQTDLGPPMPAKGTNPRLMGRWVLTSPEAFASTILVLAFDQYGGEFIKWHPTTIRRQLQEDFGVEPADANFDKLMSTITVLTTNYFYKNLSRFNDLCCGLCGHGFNPTIVSLPDAAEMAWAISEVLLIWPPEPKDREPFCDDIRHFIAAVLQQEGFVRPPDILRIAEGGDRSDQVKSDFADDPEMFAAIYQSQASKTKEVEDMIQGHLQELLDQVQRLPLQNGSTDQLVKKLRENTRLEPRREE